MVNLKARATHYGLYGESDFLAPDFIHCEPMGLQSKRHAQVIHDHIHTSLFQVFIIEAGSMVFFIQGKSYSVTGPLIVTIPENTLHGIQTEGDIKGKLITISTMVLEALFSNATLCLRNLGEPNIITNFDSSNSFEAISFFADSLYNEMQRHLPGEKLVLQNYCNLLLSLVCRLLEQESQKLGCADGRNVRYFTIFKRNIRLSCTPLKTVTQYANELDITSVHLNRICQNVVGKSALHVIHEFLILEAERLLQESEMHVCEVAYRLNFEDPAYFSRLFRKYTGVSPKEFRNKA